MDVRVLAIPTDWPTICMTAGAGILGALLGAFLPVLDARAERKVAAQERQKAIALSLLVKVGTIYSNQGGLRRAVEEGLSEPNTVEGKWQAVLPLANFPTKVFFSNEEFALVYFLKAEKLFNDLMFKDETHNAAISAFERFSLDRAALTKQLPGTVTGDVVTFALDEAQVRQFSPQFADLDALVDSMRKYRPVDEANALRLLTALTALFNEKLNMGFHFAPNLAPGGKVPG